jgi:hypothetical protein
MPFAQPIDVFFQYLLVPFLANVQITISTSQKTLVGSMGWPFQSWFTILYVRVASRSNWMEL